MAAAMKTLLTLVLLPLVAVSTLITIWLADRDKPLDVKRVWIEPEVAEACSTVDIWVERNALRSTSLRVELILLAAGKRSSIPISTDTTELRGPLGPYTYSVALDVPCNFPPGWVRVARRVYYYRNPIQRYIWPIPEGEWTAPLCIIERGRSPEEVCKTSERPHQGR